MTGSSHRLKSQTLMHWSLELLSSVLCLLGLNSRLVTASWWTLAIRVDGFSELALRSTNAIEVWWLQANLSLCGSLATFATESNSRFIFSFWSLWRSLSTMFEVPTMKTLFEFFFLHSLFSRTYSLILKGNTAEVTGFNWLF